MEDAPRLDLGAFERVCAAGHIQVDLPEQAMHVDRAASGLGKLVAKRWVICRVVKGRGLRVARRMQRLHGSEGSAMR